MLKVGKQCEKQDCKQLDFLPFECKFCRKWFCLDHRQPADHRCEDGNTNVQKRETSQDKKDRCPVTGCRKVLTLTNNYQCKICHQTICLEHRFPESHQCINNKLGPSTKGEQQKSQIKPKNLIEIQSNNDQNKNQQKKKSFFFICCGGDKQQKTKQK